MQHSLGCVRACMLFTMHGLCPLQDDDPYVRKTAAICVLKLFDINPELVDDRGFLDMLRVGTNERLHRQATAAASAPGWI